MKTGRIPTKVYGRGGRFLNRVTWVPALVLGALLLCVTPPLLMAATAEIQYDSGKRRDPMIPLVTADGKMALGGLGRAAGEFKVEGIIYDPVEGSYALINGKFCKEGDTIDDANLVSILRDRVVLSVNDAEKVIWLREEPVEK